MESVNVANAVLVDPYNLIYGVQDFDRKAFSLFFLGPKEYNVIPGKGHGENNKANKPWTEIKTMTQAPNRLLWRQIFSNHFDQHPIYKSKDVTKSKAVIDKYQIYPFKLDGLEWISVIHYLLYQLYSPDPEYAILFSLESKSNEQAFWGDLKVALNEHKKNISTKVRAFSPSFDENLASYIYNATLAKFSQHEDLKKVLIATGDAYLAERIEGIRHFEIGHPILMEVRSVLEKNPELVYFSSDQDITVQPELLTKVKKIRDVESYNYGYDINKKLGGKVSLDNLYQPLTKDDFRERKIFVKKELVDKSLRWMYILTRPVIIENIENYLSNFEFTFSVVERHVYGFTRNFDRYQSNLIVGYQKYVTSKTKMYLRYQTKDHIFYFEPMRGVNTIYHLFVITAELDEGLISSLQENFELYLGSPPGYQPKVLGLPEIVYTDSQIRRFNNDRMIIKDSLTLNQVVYQFKKILSFVSNKRILSINTILRKQLLKSLMSELQLRSYTNGEMLLNAPGSSFVREFANQFNFDLGFIKSYFEIETIPDKQFDPDDIKGLMQNTPAGMDIKRWILINSVENISNYMRLRTAFVDEIQKHKKFDEIVFTDFSSNGTDFFRGFGWIEKLPELTIKDNGVFWLCEVPFNKTVEEIFLNRLQTRMEEAKNINQPLQVLITCRTKGPLYNFLMSNNSVVFRKMLNPGYMFENPLTGSLQTSKHVLLMSLITTHENFHPFNLEILLEE